MSKTDTDLAREVMRQLGLLDAVSEADASDDAYVKSISSAQHLVLQNKKIANWQPDDIPEDYFIPLARYMSFFAGPAFGIKFDPKEEILRENALRTITAQPYSGATQRGEYF